MKINGRPLRQGDIILIPVDSLPESLPEGATAESIVLAEGEATGHCHTLHSGDMTLYGSASEQADGWLRMRSVGIWDHPDHMPAIVVVPGDYIVRRQREYSPEKIRQVAD